MEEGSRRPLLVRHDQFWWGCGVIHEDVFDAVEFVPFELVTARSSAREPAVHERQQVASKPALIRMAHEDLLRIVGVDGNLTPAAVITAATKRAIEANFIAAAVSVE